MEKLTPDLDISPILSIRSGEYMEHGHGQYSM